MHQSAARPLPPAALRVLAVTAEAWDLCRCAALPAIRTRRTPRPHGCGHAAHNTPAELRQWPYWPGFPGAAIGWR